MTVPPRRHLRGDDREKTKERAAQHYTAGLSIRAISRAIGRSYGCTRQLLLEAGVGLRGRGGGRP